VEEKGGGSATELYKHISIQARTGFQKKKASDGATRDSFNEEKGGNRACRVKVKALQSQGEMAASDM